MGLSGHVRVYENIEGSWVQIGNDIDAEAAGDELRRSVTLSQDDRIVAIASPRNDSNGSESGRVRVYQNIEGSWTQIGDDIDGEAAGDVLGNYVSLSSNGHIVAVGASPNDANGINSGHVRVYDLSEELLSVNAVSLEDDIILYPNPALKTIHINLSQNSIIENIKIYNNLGQVVLVKTDTTIDISGLVVGAYYVKVTTTNGVATKQMIVK